MSPPFTTPMELTVVLYFIAVGEFGEYLRDYRITVPALAVHRDWHVAMDADFTEQ